MQLEGVVTNVAAFGAFVDVGVHQDGLVHISELADRFVKDPREVVKAGDVVKVRVKEVDVARKRIALTMKSGAIDRACATRSAARRSSPRAAAHRRRPPPAAGRKRARRRPAPRPGTNNGSATRPLPSTGRTERHGFSSPIVPVGCTPTGELSPMAFLVGVTCEDEPVAHDGITHDACSRARPPLPPAQAMPSGRHAPRMTRIFTAMGDDAAGWLG